jgi:hypothetical protein
MATLINTTHAYLRVLVDEPNLRFRKFEGGRLDIEQDDPDYAQLMAFAERTPEIRVVESAVWCPQCGEPFAGAHAGDSLVAHRKFAHLEAYYDDAEAGLETEKAAIILERSGIACPICASQGSPRATERFPDVATMQVHSAAIHGSNDAAPPLDEEGNTIGGEDGPARTGRRRA